MYKKNQSHQKPSGEGYLYRRAFTLIELLVVIAIIGILATIVLTAVNSTRNRAKVANIQATLRNAQTAGEIHYNQNLTYAGICGDTPITYTGSGADRRSVYTNSPLQEMIDSMVSQGAKVGCWVGQEPRIGNHDSPSLADRQALGKIDWALTVYYNGNNYSVNPTGVVTFDTENAGGEGNTENWSNADSLCSSAGKRLPSVSQLRALRMAHGDQSPNNSADFGFTAHYYWSSSEYSSSHAWRVALINGLVSAFSKTDGHYVRCVA